MILFTVERIKVLLELGSIFKSKLFSLYFAGPCIPIFRLRIKENFLSIKKRVL